MSLDPYYSWDEAQDGAVYEGPRRGRFGWRVLVAVTCAIVFHIGVLWGLGQINLWLERSDFEWKSQTFRVNELEDFPESVVAPPEEDLLAAPPEESLDLLTELEELLPELDDTEIDIVPDLEKPRVALEPLKPAMIGEEDGELLEPLKAPEVEANLEELGRGEPLFQDVPDSRVVIEEGSVSGDLPDPDEFLREAAALGAGGLDENGVLSDYTEFGRYVTFDVDQLDRGRAALPSDLLFEFNSWELKQSARLGLMKLGMLIDRNPEMYCILEGHTDLFGTEPYNFELSRKRAQAVKDWLMKTLLLDGSHIIVRAYGESKAKVLEGDRDEQAINRRVDILMRKQIPAEEVVPVLVKPNRPKPEPQPEPAPPARAIPVPEDDLVDPAPQPVPRAIPVDEIPEPVIPRAIPLEEEETGPAPVDPQEPRAPLPAEPVD